MIKIIIVPNSFEPKKDRIIKEVEWQGKPISAYIPPMTIPIVSLNQKLIKDFTVIPPDNSEIIITPKKEISGIAGAIYGLFVSGGAALYTASSLLAGTMTAGMMLSTVAATAVVMAGSMILNSVLAPQMPNNLSQGISESPTYSWQPAATMPRAGSVIPILYGKHQLAGNIIQRRVEYVGDDEYLYLQLALCMGEIEQLWDGNIKINNTDITDYEDVEFMTTTGTDTQDVMQYFGDVETANNFLVDLADTPVERTTNGNATQSLRLFIQFPNGIYYQNDRGGLDAREVEFKIEYKKHSDTEWTTLQQQDTRYDHTMYRNQDCDTLAYTWDTYKGEHWCPFVDGQGNN